MWHTPYVHSPTDRGRVTERERERFKSDCSENIGMREIERLRKCSRNRILWQSRHEIDVHIREEFGRHIACLHHFLMQSHKNMDIARPVVHHTQLPPKIDRNTFGSIENGTSPFSIIWYGDTPADNTPPELSDDAMPSQWIVAVGHCPKARVIRAQGHPSPRRVPPKPHVSMGTLASYNSGKNATRKRQSMNERRHRAQGTRKLPKSTVKILHTKLKRSCVLVVWDIFTRMRT